MAAKVRGVEELIRRFNDLRETSTLERISYRATFGVSKDLRELARANAMAATQEQTGALSRGWAIKRITQGTKRGYTVGVRHGPKGTSFAQRKASEDPFYWFFLEFGTVHIAPMGFFRRAIDSAMAGAFPKINAAGRKAVIDSANRALKKFGDR